MTPVFAWGILGPDSPVKPMCTFIKVKTPLKQKQSVYLIEICLFRIQY
jgi:hypothetical protein